MWMWIFRLLAIALLFSHLYIAAGALSECNIHTVHRSSFFCDRNMKFSAALLSLSLFLWFSNSISARKDVGEYWRGVMKDQPMPEAIRGLVRHVPITSHGKADCHTDAEENPEHKGVSHFLEDFEPGLGANVHNNDAQPTKGGSFVKDFKQRSDIRAYGDDKEEKSFVNDFEPRPNISAYGDDKEVKSFVKDFEPGPNVSVYDNDAGLKVEKSFDKDIEA